MTLYPRPSTAAVPGFGALQLPPDGRVLTLRLHRPTRLRLLSGRVWITRAGWPDDHWLEAGQTLEFGPPPRWFGWRVLISGEGASPITLKAEPVM